MKTELMYITPSIAQDWLKHNTSNRRLRPAFVEELKIAFERGEWKVTHQGIAFARSGRLLDGQHRLTFISQLAPGTHVPINVTKDCDEDIFQAIDQHQRRTLSDVTGLGADIVSVGRFFARIYNGSSSIGLTPQFTIPFVEWCDPEFTELLSFTPGTARLWSASAVRAAAVYQMKMGRDKDFVLVSYDSLVRADIDSMPFGARTLMQQKMSGKIVSARTLDLFCRALRAFDASKNTKIRSILVKDQSSVLAEVRAALQAQIEKSPQQKLPGAMVAKPMRNSTAKKAA